MGYRFALLIVCLLAATAGYGQSLYKYKGEDGEWIFSDRPPDDGNFDEVRVLTSSGRKGSVKVRVDDARESVRFVASNTYYAPIQLRLVLTRVRGLETPDGQLVWTLPPASDTTLIELAKQPSRGGPSVEYQYEYIAGDPQARHLPTALYRVPFAVATDFPVTQAYPDVITHTTPDSFHAVDIAMPIGTNVFAARGGVVFDVSSDNFESGLDPERDGPSANVVQVLHDDGTYAVYAHLNWNSIRVKPGDRVARGEYIADSGNTGFSSGPHLHFVVLRNAGMRTESVPVRFEGADSQAVIPASGNVLTAY